MSGRKIFGKLKQIINLFVFIFRVIPKPLKVFLFDLTSRYSQNIFVGIRYVILKSLINSCGDNIKIGTNVTILNWKSLELGNNISIHPNCYIDAAGGITIGNNVSIAHNSSILSSNHKWNNLSKPIKYNAVELNKVIIKDDVWVGCGCRILSGVTIGSRTVLAAGAVVNKSVDSNVIYGGVPAKLIKKI